LKRFSSVVVAIVGGIGLAAARSQSTGTLTPADIETVHGRLYGGMVPGAIDQKLAGTSGEVWLNPPPHVTVNHPQFAASNFWGMASLACSRQLVAIARPANGTSHVNASRSFLYTDWTMAIGEVLRTTAKTPVTSGSAITLVWPGGELTIDGHLVHAIDPSRLQLHVGSEYLLTARAVRQTGAYSGGEAFELVGSSVLAGPGADPHWTVDRPTTLQLVKDAVGTCRGGGRH
jgi:hypothetical protein